MKKLIYLLLFSVSHFGLMASGNLASSPSPVAKTTCSNGGTNIESNRLTLSDEQKKIVSDAVVSMNRRYDPVEKMLFSTIRGYNYHTDATKGEFHDIRASFSYALQLLDSEDKQSIQRAFEVLDKTISLQEQDTTSRYCGVWPYYLEEPIKTKKSPVDLNWADFNGVTLLDIWMGYQDEIPAQLKFKIKNALVLAAKSIQKRNITLSYTNIAIMGTYVSYMVSHLFDLPEMKGYAVDRLNRFYQFTLKEKGFLEYNSPHYTVIALDELFRMKSHIIEPVARQQIDSLYSIGWETIARHYHKPSGQWAGPHSRSYSTLVTPAFKSMLYYASNGLLDVGKDVKPNDIRIRHRIPAHLMHYFLTPEYPRTETEVLRTTGTCYMTDKYALSTVNYSSFWNQRRPFLIYWGNVANPNYLQLRFLHDLYDFSSATFYSQQKENSVVAGVGFITNGGDKHISIDKLQQGKFKGKDLRLRFEFGNVKSPDELAIPEHSTDLFSIHLDELKFSLQLLQAEFEGLQGYWEKGGDGKNSWIDFVFYSGEEKEFDLNKMNKAIAAFTFEIIKTGDKSTSRKTGISEQNGKLKIDWKGLKLELPVKPQNPRNSYKL